MQKTKCTLLVVWLETQICLQRLSVSGDAIFKTEISKRFTATEHGACTMSKNARFLKHCKYFISMCLCGRIFGVEFLELARQEEQKANHTHTECFYMYSERWVLRLNLWIRIYFLFCFILSPYRVSEHQPTNMFISFKHQSYMQVCSWTPLLRAFLFVVSSAIEFDVFVLATIRKIHILPFRFIHLWLIKHSASSNKHRFLMIQRINWTPNARCVDAKGKENRLRR